MLTVPESPPSILSAVSSLYTSTEPSSSAGTSWKLIDWPPTPVEKVSRPLNCEET